MDQEGKALRLSLNEYVSVQHIESVLSKPWRSRNYLLPTPFSYPETLSLIQTRLEPASGMAL